jgi:SAM-dependent methyltransferase
MKPRDQWGKMARQWDLVGQPLRPGPEDIAALEKFVAQIAAPQPEALLLGVTREIAGMRWPEGTRLLAVDRSVDMIEYAWVRPEVAGRRGLAEASVTCGDWRNLPVPDGSRDLIVGDGCLVLIDYPTGAGETLASVHRALRPGGLFSHRFFLRPEAPEDPEQVFDDLRAGRIGNFHIFKWRIAMSLHGTIEEGVRLGDIWNRWHTAVPDPAALAEQLAWPLETVATIDAYRDMDTRFTYYTLDEARRVAAPWFREIDRFVPGYETGERYQTLLFEAV